MRAGIPPPLMAQRTMGPGLRVPMQRPPIGVRGILPGQAPFGQLPFPPRNFQPNLRQPFPQVNIPPNMQVKLWNELPIEINNYSCSNVDSFKRKLKTHESI